MHHGLSWLSGQVAVLRFSPDGQHFAVGSRGKAVQLYRMASTADGGPAAGCRRLATLSGHSTRVISLDFSADGTFLQSNSAAGELLYWEARLPTDSARRSAGAAASAQTGGWRRWRPGGRLAVAH